MKVRVHPADRWGCGHYRLIWAAEALKARGYDVEIAHGDMGSGIAGRMVGNDLVEVMVRPGFEADVYVFQRTTARLLTQMIKLMRRKGHTVVIDMDDDLSCIHPKNAAFRMLHPKLSPQGNWLHVAEACRHASLVTVSTPQLLSKYAAHGRGLVLDNYVPESYLSVPRPERGQRRWGWAGAIHSHPDDVPILRGICDTLKDHEFHLVGSPEGVAKALGLRIDPPGPGIVSIAEWPAAIAETMDVGTAPLADSRFNNSKSWLKPLEYAALGIPFVASDRPEYRRFQKLAGAGHLARSDRPRDWVPYIKRMLTDDDAYRAESSALREFARTMTIEQHAERWWEAWVHAYEMDHGGASVPRSATSPATV